MPAEDAPLHDFVMVDRKAYPARGAVRAVPPLVNHRSGVTRESVPVERWAWQKEALEKWAAARYYGIIEAVTGSGKTYLAMEAWRRLVERHKHTYTLVVVPSITLQGQWYERLSQQFPEIRVARLGNGHDDTFAAGKICVAVVNSVVGVGREASEARLHGLFDHCRKFRENRSFLIADECHHYIDAEVFKRVRTLVSYDAVLALSATVGANFAIRGLGEIVYTYTFADAVRRGDLPPLTLLNVKCRLDTDERRKYDDLSDQIRSQITYLQRIYEEEFEQDEFSEDFWSVLRRIDREAGPDGEPAIRRLMITFFKRAGILYLARDKQSVARDLIGTLLGSPNRRKVIVFFERIASAEDGAAILELEAAKIFQDAIATVGLWTGVLHSELKDVERRRVIDEFRSNARGVLFVCRMLDEGFDVPDVDAAVLVASTKSKRQRVQRIGRVLRRGDGQKQPVVLTLFCEQTTDQFVVAADRELFGEDTTIETVTAAQAREFLQGHRRERKHGGV
jgi:superfamily II DNA or RNA helicase